jgi:hypothetical protein
VETVELGDQQALPLEPSTQEAVALQVAVKLNLLMVDQVL